MTDSSGEPGKDTREELPVIDDPSGSFADCCGSDGSDCSSSLEIGFEGFSVTAEDSADTETMRSAWKATLAREGKLHPEAKSLRDLMKPSS